ncbi:MAG TPA: YkgJ family cysteine cluster protein [Myxococcales bacterium]|nr:YkgJ family cysteine cluster protein [Myxococcales bacterium]HIK86449.1 YkgJ family cysteine cluster protein [Myxococcales bacterium]
MAEALVQVLSELVELHHEIDRAVETLETKHVSRLQCRRGCSACCLDDLSATRLEAEHIRRNHSVLLESSAPHATGACAFLDAEGACRIYESRPVICRSQGLPLRILFENELQEIEEQRDICSLNEAGGPPVESLEEEDCWLVGPHELRVQRLDDQAFGEDALLGSAGGEVDDGSGRIPLRALFVRDCGRSEEQ